eukprot:TRINITY_DN948_c0_g1_i1.p1 TRINITY_DN948_c0_g1~~TRINITY_DN948_c0_g1_i1.p1  ORF type:complete len:212 (-),score=35.46 TRINITY_DN948_c0_g1_i1:138-773(-)
MASGVAMFDFSIGAVRYTEESCGGMASIAEVPPSMLTSPSSSSSSGDEEIKSMVSCRKKSAPKECPPSKTKKKSHGFGSSDFSGSDANQAESCSLVSSLSSSFSLRDRSPSEAPRWIPDELCSACMICGDGFSFWNRRHHCRMCGTVACHECSKWTMQLPNLGYGASKQRVCQPCFSVETAVATQFQDGFDLDLKHGFSFEKDLGSKQRRN